MLTHVHKKNIRLHELIPAFKECNLNELAHFSKNIFIFEELPLLEECTWDEAIYHVFHENGLTGM